MYSPTDFVLIEGDFVSQEEATTTYKDLHIHHPGPLPECGTMCLPWSGVKRGVDPVEMPRSVFGARVFARRRCAMPSRCMREVRRGLRPLVTLRHCDTRGLLAWFKLRNCMHWHSKQRVGPCVGRGTALLCFNFRRISK